MPSCCGQVFTVPSIPGAPVLKADMTTDATSSAPTMHPNKRNFVEGLGLVLDRWVALQMAVEMGWGGHDTASKAEGFKAGLIDYFDQGMCAGQRAGGDFYLSPMCIYCARG